MQLDQFYSKPNSNGISKLLKEHFNLDIPTQKLTVEKATLLRESVQKKISIFRNSVNFHTSEKNPAYLSLIMLENILAETYRDASERAVNKKAKWYTTAKEKKQSIPEKDRCSSCGGSGLDKPGRGWENAYPGKCNACGGTGRDPKNKAKNKEVKESKCAACECGDCYKHQILENFVPNLNKTEKLSESGARRLRITDGLDKLIDLTRKKVIKYQSMKDINMASINLKDLADLEEMKDLVANKQYAEVHVLMLKCDPSLQSKLHNAFGEDFFKVLKKHSPRYYKNAITEGIGTRLAYGAGRIAHAAAKGLRGQHLSSDWHNNIPSGSTNTRSGNTVNAVHQPTALSNKIQFDPKQLPKSLTSIMQAISATSLAKPQKIEAMNAIYGQYQISQMKQGNNVSAQGITTPQMTKKQVYANPSNNQTPPSAQAVNTNNIQSPLAVANDVVSRLVKNGINAIRAKEMIKQTIQNDPSSANNAETLYRATMRKK